MYHAKIRQPMSHKDLASLLISSAGDEELAHAPGVEACKCVSNTTGLILFGYINTA
jgi:hypothetical protein